MAALGLETIKNRGFSGRDRPIEGKFSHLPTKNSLIRGSAQNVARRVQFSKGYEIKATVPLK